MHGQARTLTVLCYRSSSHHGALEVLFESSHGLPPSTSDPNHEYKYTSLISVNRTHHLLARTEQKLLLQLQQIELVLRTASLEVDLCQQLAYTRDNLRYLLFISAVVWCLLKHRLKERWRRVVGFIKSAFSSNLRESGLRSAS